MSRAFLSDNDGWQWCSKLQDFCIYAQGNDECMLSKCRKIKDPEEKKNGTETKKTFGAKNEQP